MSGAGLVGVLIVGCYLVGGIPFGFLVGRLHGLDIRKAGSGNIGATNVGRLLGRKWGILVFVLDVCKGLLPTLGLGQFLPGAEGLAGWSPAVVNTAWLAGGVACILGHNFPIYLRFRGGKGVATSLGVVLGVYPYLTVSGLCAFGVWVVVTLISRYVSAGSICAAVAFPICYLAWLGLRREPDWSANLPIVGFAVLMSGLVIYRHRENIKRLRAGTESKIGSRPNSSLADR
jgi:glycerol-3-phosphate acyltransferase PlsY